MRCIYCTEEKPAGSFRKREHVIPQAFGRFAPDNLVLKDTVCDDCNQLFGNEIELYLCRDTLESIERLRHGMTPKAPLANRRRVKSRITSGVLKGAIVREQSIAESGCVMIEPVVQVGFYHIQRGEYAFFEPKDIPSAKQLIEDGYAIINDKVLLIAKDGEEMDGLVAKLSEQGIPLDPKTDDTLQQQPEGSVSVETNLTLDRTIMRGFCKIAFNYLSYIAGKDFVLSPEFDPIRKFIRNDEGKSDLFLSVNLPHILNDDRQLERSGSKITEGHLIIVGWNGRKILANVSLFNLETFGITLCQGYGGIWRPIRSGHHFDIESREVSKIAWIPKALMV